MKSTPFELRAFYLPGHDKNPIQTAEGPKVVPLPGVRNVGGFNFTDGAMSLRLPQLKSQRQARYLERFHNVASEVLELVDVPARARTFSPKSEAEGILGLVDEDAAASAEGQSAQGSGNADASAGGAPALQTNGSGHRQRRAGSGSSVATKTPVDAATRQRLLGGGPSADNVKATDGADGLT